MASLHPHSGVSDINSVSALVPKFKIEVTPRNYVLDGNKLSLIIYLPLVSFKLTGNVIHEDYCELYAKDQSLKWQIYSGNTEDKQQVQFYFF